MGSTRDVCSSFNSSRVSGSKQNIRFVSMDSRDGAWCWDKTRGVLEAQVYLCESQFEAYFKEGVATWYDPDDDVKKFRCSGMEPTTFSKRNSSTHGEVPFKFMSRNSLVALEGYTRAFRAGKVDEPPAYLINVRLNGKDALSHFMTEDIRVYTGVKALAFTKTVNGANSRRCNSTVSEYRMT